MQEQYDAFEKRGTVVIAIAQEDTDLRQHAELPAKIKPAPRFEIVADLNRQATGLYDRTTAYLIDKEGTVRQVFPMLIRSRPSWPAILGQVDQLTSK